MHYLLIAAALLLSQNGIAQNIPAYTAADLMQRTSNEDTLYVVNFWATWCGPCVKELPEFNDLYEANKDRPVKLLMVSLDFKEDYQRKLPAFLKKKKMEQEVVWLNESNANEFIPKIEEKWQGSIPATLLLYRKNGYRNFFEGAVTAKQIQTLIDRQMALGN